MTKNIKLPVSFRREYSVSISYHFFEIDKMFTDFLSESCEEGGISLLGNEDESIFQGYVFQISLNFWLSVTTYFS